MENTSHKALAKMLRDALARQHGPIGEFHGVIISTELCNELATRLENIEEEKARAARVAAMVDLATHAIGMNNKKPYKRHGQTWYKPYRNYYCAGSQGDPVWDEMVKQGYAEASKGLSSVYYFMTRAGLDWLGEQTGINIHDEER